MKPSDIGKAYNQITHLWERKDFNRDNGIDAHNKALMFVKNPGHALDVGCGCTGRFIDLLDGKGYSVAGLDISEKMIALARERHPDIQFYHDDICQWELPQKYDFISAWDSIWHIPLIEQKPVLTKLISGLKPGGVLLFSCGGTDEQGDQRDDFMGPEVYYSTLGINGFLNLFMSLGCVCRHLEYDQYPELHTYMIIQKT